MVLERIFLYGCCDWYAVYLDLLSCDRVLKAISFAEAMWLEGQL